MSDFHLSDCDIHEGRHCSCGGLEPAELCRHGRVVSIVAGPRGLGVFVDHDGAECFIEVEQLPTDILATLAAAAHLPDPHEVMPLGTSADAMNLDDAREAIIGQLKALALSQSIAGDLLPHFDLCRVIAADDASVGTPESMVRHNGRVTL